MSVTIRERVKGSGVWWVFVNHQGARKAKKVGAKSAAKEVARRIEAKIAAQGFKIEEHPAPTFGFLAREWIEIVVPATCKASTEQDYRRLLAKHVLPVFGKQPVDQITRLKVKDFLLGKIKAGYAASSVTHMKNVVSGVMGRALEAEIIPANPAQAIGRLYREKPRGQEVNPFTWEELEALLAAFRERWPREYPLVLTLARTGVRLGEALGLKWEDLDFVRRVMHVRRSYSGRRIETPKSGKSRPVDLSPQLARELQELQTRRKREALARGWREVPEYVFVGQKGQLMDKGSWRRRYWVPTLQAAGVSPHRIHDLRHTYATLRIQAGHNVADVSGQLGHYSVKFTLDQYYHWLPGKAKNEVDALDRLQSPATQAQPEIGQGVSHAG